MSATAYTGTDPASVAVTPSDHNYAGWTFDPISVQGGAILPTAGISYVVRFRAQLATISALNLHFTLAGAGLSNCYMSLHSDAGVLLNANAVSADQSTLQSNWQAGGLKNVPLLAAQAVTIGAWYKARWWVGAATTLPTVSRGINSSTVITNAGLLTPNFRFATADSGLTTPALAPTTIGTPTGGATAWWLAATP